MKSDLDLVINSSGLTDFNPDLRTALNVNVDGTLQVLDFLKHCRRARLLHLSTCYVAGSRDGRIREQLQPDYTPIGTADIAAVHLDELQRHLKLFGDGLRLWLLDAAFAEVEAVSLHLDPRLFQPQCHTRGIDAS